MRKKQIVALASVLYLCLAVPLVLAAPGDYEISDGRVSGLWHLEDEVDSSGNGYNLTNNGTTTFVTGKLGDAASFNGTSQWLSNTSADWTNGSPNSWAFCFWAYADSSTNAYRRMFGNNQSDLVSNDIIFREHSTADQIQLLGNGAALNRSYNIGSFKNAWQFYCVNADGTNTKIFLNGSQITSDVSAIPAINSVYIGGRYNTGNLEYFDGLIDEAILLNDALTTDEITALYNSGDGRAVCNTAGCGDEETGTTTASSTVGQCDMTAGAIDDDTISTFMLYWFYVMLGFIILTLGYWIVDRFFHSLGGKKYD